MIEKFCAMRLKIGWLGGAKYKDRPMRQERQGGTRGGEGTGVEPRAKM